MGTDPAPRVSWTPGTVSAAEMLDTVARTLDSRLRAYARTRCGSGSAWDPDDLVHELYVRLPELLPHHAPVEDVFSYLCGCLRRISANHHRRARRRMRLVQDVIGVGRPEEERVEQNADMLRGGGYEGDLLEHILRELTPDQADLLVRRYLWDETADEIGRRLGIGSAVTRARIHRAMVAARRVAASRARHTSPPS